MQAYSEAFTQLLGPHIHFRCIDPLQHQRITFSWYDRFKNGYKQALLRVLYPETIQMRVQKVVLMLYFL